ncbi:MAG TPA: hypothetical protein VMT34_13250 [Aggregatilineales bacterium]|nr:hypothetical protein [Aggregatilineales bacterium]
MRKPVLQALAIAALLTASACSATSEPVFPTLAPTRTEVPPLTSLSTPISSPTGAIQAPIATDGPSPTPLLAFVPTRSLFTATATPKTLLAGNLQIEYFAASAATIKPGDALTLFWSVKGVDNVAIYRLNPDGTRGQVWNRPRSGSLRVQTSDTDRDSVQYLLTIEVSGTHLEQTLTVGLACSGGWFFDPQPPGPCPGVTATLSDAVEQPFEHGRMIWIKAEARVYVIFNDGKQPTWNYYADEYKDGQPPSDPKISPPAGFLQPIRGFGLVWRTQDKVRDRLGWAILAELSFAGALQGDATIAGGTAYIRTRDGQIIQLVDKGASWKLITP